MYSLSGQQAPGVSWHPPWTELWPARVSSRPKFKGLVTSPANPISRYSVWSEAPLHQPPKGAQGHAHQRPATPPAPEQSAQSSHSLCWQHVAHQSDNPLTPHWPGLTSVPLCHSACPTGLLTLTYPWTCPALRASSAFPTQIRPSKRQWPCSSPGPSCPFLASNAIRVSAVLQSARAGHSWRQLWLTVCCASAWHSQHITFSNGLPIHLLLPRLNLLTDPSHPRL